MTVYKLQLRLPFQQATLSLTLSGVYLYCFPTVNNVGNGKVATIEGRDEEEIRTHYHDRPCLSFSLKGKHKINPCLMSG